MTGYSILAIQYDSQENARFHELEGRCEVLAKRNEILESEIGDLQREIAELQASIRLSFVNVIQEALGIITPGAA